MTDHSNMKLGRKAVISDSRTLKVSTYMGATLPAAPADIHWAEGQAQWGMMLNDTLGDCTIAGVGHAIELWSHAIGKEVTIPDSDVLAMYEKWDGYKPSDPSTDQGGIELNVLNQWKNEGFFGHKLDAFATVNIHNVPEARSSLYLFGGLYLGIALPLSAQNQEVWDVVQDDGTGNTEPGSWGGHCVFGSGYDQTGFYCITWGAIKKMTTAFWLKYVDEAYALLGQDFINAKGVDPQGFNLDQLKADLTLIK